MEAVVGAVAEDHRQLVVGALIVVVPELVVDRREVLGVDVDAHLDAQVIDAVHVPGTGVTHHFAVTGLHEHRPFPERLRQRCEAKR